MQAAVLQIVGSGCLVIAAWWFSPIIGLIALGIVLLVFGTLEELR